MDFESFAASHGLILKSLEVGRWVRVPTVDHPRSRNGSYFFGVDYGHCQNWAEMTACESWREDKPMSPRDTSLLRSRMDASRNLHAQERAQAAQKAAEKAKAIIKSAKLEKHAVLDAHGFPDMVGLVWRPPDDENNNLLIVPMWIGNEIVGCQTMNRDGEKKFLFGQRCSGAEHRMGAGDLNFWVEGYCTGLAVRAALRALNIRATVRATFSAGNLKKMATRGIIIADHDKSGVGEAAAKATGLPYYLPEVEGDDFCDVWQRIGTVSAGMLLLKFFNSVKALHA